MTVQQGGGNVWTWLGPVLLSGASLVASGLAYVGIRKSNATNEAAITAADKRATGDRSEARLREFDTWRRDTLLQLGFEVVENAIQIQDEYFAVAFSKAQIDENQMAPIDQWGRKIGAAVISLRIIGAHVAAQRCTELRRAVNDSELVSTTVAMNFSFRVEQGLIPGNPQIPPVPETRERFD